MLACLYTTIGVGLIAILMAISAGNPLVFGKEKEVLKTESRTE